jgi:hypothetical protein
MVTLGDLNLVNSKDLQQGQDMRFPARSASQTEDEILRQSRQQRRRLLTLIIVAGFMDIAVLSFLTLSAVIAAKYFPNVPEELTGTWKVLGLLSLALSVAAKVVIIRSWPPTLPLRSAANFPSIIRRQGRIYDRMNLWGDLRFIVRSLCLSLIAFIFTQCPTSPPALDWAAVALFLISVGIIALNLLKARAQRPKADDSLLGAVRLLIFQTHYRIEFVGKRLLLFIIPFVAGAMLLSQNIPRAKGEFPIGAPADHPFHALALSFIAFIAAAMVTWAQFWNIRRRQIRLRQRLEQLEQLLAELSAESNRGETLPFTHSSS